MDNDDGNGEDCIKSAAHDDPCSGGGCSLVTGKESCAERSNAAGGGAAAKKRAASSFKLWFPGWCVLNVWFHSISIRMGLVRRLPVLTNPLWLR